MRRRLSLLLALTAWLMATGSHWDLVQTVAWSRMFATYAGTVPLSEALRLTFAPGNECAMCDLVQRAKQPEPGPALPDVTASGKIVLGVPPSSEVVVAEPARDPWPTQTGRDHRAWRDQPTVPPPRC